MNKKYNYEIQVPLYLLDKVGKLYEYTNLIGYDDSYHYYGYNDNYGNVYVYSEYEQFTLFISEFDADDEIKFCYTDLNDGQELILTEKEMLVAIDSPYIHGKTDKINGYFSDWQDRKDKVKEQKNG